MQTIVTMENQVELSEDDRNTLAHALRVAASKYTDNQRTCRALDNLRSDAIRALADQFERQASDALLLADLIDNAGEIYIVPAVDEIESGRVSGGDMCDACYSSGVQIDHTRDGRTICVQCAEETEEDCDCNERSWYGKQHDSACPLAGKSRTTEEKPE